MPAIHLGLTGMPATVAPMSAASTSPNETWTTRSLLRWMTEHFEARGVESPRVIAEMLLAHVLECDRMRLYMEVDRSASQDERTRLRQLVARASRDEPVQYLLGEGWFFGKAFAVNPSTLIPRPATETIVEHLLQALRGEGEPESQLIADIGTGTGCIAISLAGQLPGAKLIATDISAEALELASSNAERHEVADRVEFRRGSRLEPIADMPGTFDAICSNPPYIPDHEWEDVAANVKNYEPEAALRGGADGLDLIRPLISDAPGLLKPGGRLYIEIAACNREAVIKLAQQAGNYEDIEVLRDQEGLDRVLIARRVMNS